MDLNRFFHVLNDESLKDQMENDIENFKSSPYYK